MPKYTVLLGPIATDVVFQTGDTIELSEEDAFSLLHLGAIVVSQSEMITAIIPPIEEPKKPEPKANITKPKA